jgi:hypothetical protein
VFKASSISLYFMVLELAAHANSITVVLLLDQGLPEDTDTVHTRVPGLVQETGHTETDEPSSLPLLCTLIDEWVTTETAKVVRSPLADL